MISELEKLIGSGLPQEVACRVAGIQIETLQVWLREARNGKGGTYGELLQAITRARGKAEGVAIAQIRTAGATDWRASAWWLSHHPHTRDRWSDAGAVRKAEADLLARVVGVLEAEIPDPTTRHRIFLAMQAAGCGVTPEATDGEA